MIKKSVSLWLDVVPLLGQMVSGYKAKVIFAAAIFIEVIKGYVIMVVL